MGNNCSFEARPDDKERIRRNRSWFLHSKHHKNPVKSKNKKKSGKIVEKKRKGKHPISNYESLNSFDSSSPQKG
jgi:hypothetical protein